MTASGETWHGSRRPVATWVPVGGSGGAYQPSTGEGRPSSAKFRRPVSPAGPKRPITAPSRRFIDGSLSSHRNTIFFNESAPTPRGDLLGHSFPGGGPSCHSNAPASSPRTTANTPARVDVIGRDGRPPVPVPNLTSHVRPAPNLNARPSSARARATIRCPPSAPVMTHSGATSARGPRKRLSPPRSEVTPSPPSTTRGVDEPTLQQKVEDRSRSSVRIDERGTKPHEEGLWGTRVRRALQRSRIGNRFVGVLHRHTKVALVKIESMSADELTSYLRRGPSKEWTNVDTKIAFRRRSTVGRNKLPTGLDVPAKGLLTAEGRAETLHRRIEADTRSLREAAQYVDLGFEAQAAGVRMESKLHAARAYDERNMHRSGFTQYQLSTLRYDPTSAAATSGYHRGLSHVLRNRYAEIEHYDPFGPDVPPPKTPGRYHRYHKPWRLEDSQWVPRRDKGNSHDFFETTTALNRMLETDWVLAREHHQLAWVICQAQLQPEALKLMDKAQASSAPCVAAVHQALQRHALVIYNAFDHYAMLDKKPTTDVLNQSEMFYVRLNQYISFVLETHLDDNEQLDLGQIENIFSITDAPDKATKSKDPHNSKGSLNRHEWLQVLVRLAMRKFCHLNSRSNLVGNVADAVDRLCIDHLMAFLPSSCLINPNDFRKAYCYREGTDRIVKEHRKTLRNLYEVYSAQGNGGINDEEKLADKSKMSLGEWLTFVQHAGLVELGMLSWRAAMQAFASSRIRAASGWNNAQEIRVRHLMYEDFVEAVVRLANIIALPTVEEIDTSGAADAGDFMLALYGDAPEAFRQFVASRTIAHGERNTTQRIHRCVGHLLALIRRVIWANAIVDNNVSNRNLLIDNEGPISKGVIEKFFHSRHIKGGAQPRPLVLPTSFNISGAALKLAMAQVEESIFRALRSVLAFDCLSDEDIQKLRVSMSVAKYAHGEYVFEQGDSGDVFYLITGGEAEVLHYDPSDPKQRETLLNVIGTSACFGETALIQRAPRNASIMAKGDLHVTYISRDDFEKALGRSLAEMRLAHDEQDALRLEMMGATEIIPPSDAVGDSEK